jgi:hypothetical protein
MDWVNPLGGAVIVAATCAGCAAGSCAEAGTAVGDIHMILVDGGRRNIVIGYLLGD